MRDIVQHAAAAAMVVDAATGPVVADVAAHLAYECPCISLATTPAVGDIAWADVLAGPSPVAPMGDVDANSMASLIYTSGTTGQPRCYSCLCRPTAWSPDHGRGAAGVVCGAAGPLQNAPECALS